MEIINESSEKFKDMQSEICGFLFDLLRRINELENEIYERNQEIKAKKPELGIPEYQVAPGEEELWNEYEQRLGEIVKPHCSEKLLKRGFGNALGKPAKYGYIDGECAVNFIMKTAKKADVITHFKHGIDCTHKFVIKNVDGAWSVDEVYYGFESEPGKWHADSIR